MSYVDAVNEKTKDIKPITREEMFLQKIADNVSGGGGTGGGGVSDYNDLSNTPVKPFPISYNEVTKGNYVYINELEEDVFYCRTDDVVNLYLAFCDTSYRGSPIILRYMRDDPYKLFCKLKITEQIESAGEYIGKKLKRFVLSDGVTLSSVRAIYEDDGTVLDVEEEHEVFSESDGFIQKNNKSNYSVNDDYQPAHKKYVDETATEIATELVNTKFEEFTNSYVPPLSNWSQNDPTGLGYIENRTHYEEPDPENSTDTLTWDGVIGEKVAMPLDEEGTTLMVQISEAELTVNDLIGGSLTFSNGTQNNTSTITEDLIQVENGAIVVADRTPYLLFFPANNEIGAPGGIYVLYIDSMGYVSQLVCSSAVFGAKIIHKLPEKYIPEMSSVTLVSSGGKRFKVTVDDSGTLSATEITE